MSTIRQNAAVAPRQLSTWVVIAICGAAQYWLSLTDAEQAKFLAAFPFLADYGGLIGFGAWIVAKLWPQNVTVPANAETVPETRPQTPIDPAELGGP